MYGRMRSLVFGVAILAVGAACTHDAPPAARAHVRLPAFERADLVALRGGGASFYSLAGDHVEALDTLPIDHGADAKLDGDWADRDHLFVGIGAARVVAITAAGMRPIAVPDLAAVPARAPERDAIDLRGAQLAVRPGEAWLMTCLRGEPEGGACTTTGGIRLWPAPAETCIGCPAPVAWAWRNGPPPGVTTRVADDNVTCTPVAGPPVTITTASASEHMMGAYWVSASPPRLLVVYGVAGYSDVLQSRWSLHDGCTAPPVAGGDWVAAGPDGLWIATQPTSSEPHGVTVWRGATRLGELPDALVRFRPAPPATR